MPSRERRSRERCLHGEKLLFFINELLHLLKEVTLDLCEVKEFLDGSALAECLVHDELSLAAGLAQHGHELLERKVMEVLGESESVSADLKAPYSLLECFLICLTDAHYLADSTHLCAELVLNTLKLLKCPSCKLDNNVVAVRNVLVKRTVLAARDLVESKTRSEHCGNEGDGETRCLRSKCRRT